MSRISPIALLRQTYDKWNEHNAPRLGASLAFYSVLSFAPLVVLVTGIIALIFGQSNAQGALINEARQVIGERGAETVQTLLNSSTEKSTGIVASVIAFITLLFGASGVFAELQSALNVVWEAPPKTSEGITGYLKDRLFTFGMVLSVGFLLLVTLMLSAGLAFVGHSFQHLLPVPAALLQAVNFLLSVVVVAGLFTLMFKVLPNVPIRWRDAFRGGLATAVLFSIGKLLLGLYLGRASIASTYGAAGSLVAVIVWIYYSAQIFFFGAELTHVYTETRDHDQKSAEPATTTTAHA